MSVIYRLRILSFRKKFAIVAGVLLVFGLMGAVMISQEQQEIRSRAAGDIHGDHVGDLVGNDFRVAGKVLGNVIGDRNQISNGVTGNVWGDANSINGNVEGCINGNNNRVAGNVSGGIVGLNNIVSGTKGSGDCPRPGVASPTDVPTQNPTATIEPTKIPTSQPTTTPVIEPTKIPTSQPTTTPVISPTGSSIGSELRFALLLHGIGEAGDSANPNGGGNPNPKRSQRQITVEIFNSQNQLVLTRQGSVSFNQAAGNFVGSIDIGSTLQSGSYTIKVKTSQFLRALVPGIQNLSSGVQTLPVTRLVVGDVNGDNALNILDYNLLMGCYSDFQPPVSCNSENKILTDLDDDGATNQFDYNLFLRELTNRQGE